MGLLGSIFSSIFGGKKKQSKTTQKGTSAYQPYQPTIPYINDYLTQTKALYNGGAPQISPYEQAGYDKLKGIVDGGATALNPAIAANNDTLSGKYLDPSTNPYIADIAKRSAGMAGAQALSSFAGAGRTGSGLGGYYAGKGAADASNDIFYQNYGDERGRMQSAVGMAPALEAGRYLGPQAEISAGQNISSRPYDINQQYGGILAKIGQLGQQGQTTGTATGYGYSPGLLGSILNSFTNKLFPGGSSGPFGG
jgi:hypothetical protein